MHWTDEMMNQTRQPKNTTTNALRLRLRCALVINKAGIKRVVRVLLVTIWANIPCAFLNTIETLRLKKTTFVFLGTNPVFPYTVWSARSSKGSVIICSRSLSTCVPFKKNKSENKIELVDLF